MKATAIYNENGTVDLLVGSKRIMFETVSSMVNYCKANDIQITVVSSNLLM